MKHNINTKPLAARLPKFNQDEQWAIFDIKETQPNSLKYKYYWISDRGNSAVTYSYKDGVKKLKAYPTSSKKVGGQYLAFASNDLTYKYVHQAVAAMFVMNHEPAVTKYVNHKDGNKLNNHRSNLEWVTARQNYWHWRGVADYMAYE